MLKNRKTLAALLVVVLVAGVLASGCGGTKEKTTVKTGTEMAADQTLRYNLGPEPKTIDPGLCTFTYEANVVLANYEGLTRINSKSEPVSGIAERWDISTDQKTYTFHLRDTKWTNGDPVKASDFVFAWTRALDPKNASEYAYQLYYLKNAQKFNEGDKTVKATDLGFKAIDDKTLEVTLENPTPYFLFLTAFQTYMPVNQKVVEASPDKWASEAATYIGNGPYKMAAWKHNEKMEWVKNPDYWDASNVKLDKMTWTIIETETTELNTFQTGQIDLGSLPPPAAEMPRLENEGKLVISPFIGTYFYDLNVKQAPLDNVKVRKALNLAIDRESIVKNITKAGEKAAYAWIAPGMKNSGKDFREVGGDFVKFDITEAKKLLSEAGYPDGKGFPKLKLIYNTNERHKAIAEAVQEMWRQNLGVEISLQNLETKVLNTTRVKKDYQIARDGWIGDYLDPMTFADYFMTDGGNNNTNWGNPEYDKQINTAKSSSDQAVRMQAMHDAEKVLFDEQPLIPIFFYTNPFVKADFVKDVFFSAQGLTDFKPGWIAKH